MMPRICPRAPAFARRFLSTSPATSESFGGAKRTGRPGVVIFDKDGTLIDFQLMWGTWIESLAWKLEMESQKPVRDLIFERLGYDWLKRSVVSGGPICCTPMEELRNIALKAMLDTGVPEFEAHKLMEEKWVLPDGTKKCRPLADLGSLCSELQASGVKVAVCTSDSREPTVETLAHLGVGTSLSSASLSVGRSVTPF